MVVILFGVTGAGKTVVGQLLAGELGWRFYDADDYHSAASVEKMRTGVPLDDGDRQPWLERLRARIEECLAAGENAVLACSALKGAYRDYLTVDGRVKLVHLSGDFDLIAARLRARRGHYMNPDLLRSQFETLEPPDGDALVVDVQATPPEIVRTIRESLRL
jgi:gluconokinase